MAYCGFLIHSRRIVESSDAGVRFGQVRGHFASNLNLNLRFEGKN